jgi:hypothetical protein
MLKFDKAKWELRLEILLAWMAANWLPFAIGSFFGALIG